MRDGLAAAGCALTCSATGPIKLRATSSSPGSTLNSLVFCWSKGCWNCAADKPRYTATRRRGGGAVPSAAALPPLLLPGKAAVLLPAGGDCEGCDCLGQGLLGASL